MPGVQRNIPGVHKGFGQEDSMLVRQGRVWADSADHAAMIVRKRYNCQSLPIIKRAQPDWNWWEFQVVVSE